MATVQGTSYGTYGSHYDVYLDYSVTSQEIANNRSYVKLRQWAQADGTAYSAWSGVAANNYSQIKVDGGQVHYANQTMDFRNRAVVELGSWEGWITHGDDGKKTIALYSKYDINGPSSIDWGEVSYNFVLTDIPRASEITSFPGFNIDNPQPIVAPRKSASFINEWGIYVGATAIKGSPRVAQDSYTFSAADLDAIYAHIPNSTAITVTCYVNTYAADGTTFIGQKSASSTAYVSGNIKPTLSSLTASETMGALSGVIPAGTYLQNYSKVYLSANGAAGAKSSTISSYYIDFGGYAFNASTGTTNEVNTSGTVTGWATVTDSRGRVSDAVYVSTTFLAFPNAISSFPNFTIGSGVTGTLPRAHANLRNTFQIKVGATNIAGPTGKLDANSYTFTAGELDAIYAQIPSATSATVTFIATTYSGTHAINTQTTTATASVGSTIIPTFSAVTAAETIAYLNLVTPLTFLQNVSKVQFNITGAAGVKSSSISSYNINFNGSNYAGASPLTGVINANGNIVATATVTDSRGRTSAARTLTLNFLQNPMGGLILPNFTIGNGGGVTATAPRAHTSFTNTFTLKIADLVITKAGISANTVAFTAADLAGIFAKMSTTTTATITLEVGTYSGGTSIGAIQTTTGVVTIDTAVVKPSLSSVTVAEGVATVNTLALGNNASSQKYFAQNLSKVAFTINGAAGSTGSGIASYKVNFNSTDYSGATSTTAILNLSGVFTATATVTDLRGTVSAPKTVTVEFLPYVLPRIMGFSGSRHKETALGSGIYVPDLLGTFVNSTVLGNITSLNSKNVLTYTLSYRLRGTSPWTQLLTASLAAGVISLNTNLVPTTPPFLITAAYDFQLVISDKFNTTASIYPISTGSVPLSLSKLGIGIGKVWQQGSLDVQGDMYIDGVMKSLVTTGTAPLVIASTTVVPNLNVDMLDGKHASDFAPSAHAHGTYDRGTGLMTGGIVLSKLVVSDGIVTEVGERTLTAADVSAVPTTRTVNAKALNANISLTAADVSALPIAGGTMTGRLIGDTPQDYDAATIAGVTSAPFDLPLVNIGATAAFLPFNHMSASHSQGYITHLVTGLYKSTTDWSNSAFFVGLGGADANPTEYYTMSYGGAIRHSSGTVRFDNMYVGGTITTNAGILTTASAQHTFNTPYGNIQLGPMNASYAHIYTDRPSFYFNKPLIVNGTAVSMNGHGHSNYAPALPSNGTYWGIVGQDGNDYHWIRTTTPGLLPHSTSNTSKIGSAGGWAFNDGYFKNLHVQGTLWGNDVETSRFPWADNIDHFSHSVAGAYLAIFNTNGTTYGASTFVSDENLKSNIRDFEDDALSKIKKIKHKKYDWKDGHRRNETGYTAQQLQNVDPEFAFAIEQPDGSNIWAPDVTKLLPALTRAVQQLSQKADSQQKEIEVLKLELRKKK